MLLLSSSVSVLCLLGALLIYWVVLRTPHRRQVFLALAGLGAVAYMGWMTATGLLLLSILVFFMARKLRSEPRPKLRWLWLAMTVPVLPLLVFKYLPLRKILPRLPGPPWDEVPIPPGISYFTFKKIHYLVDSWRGQIPEHSFASFLAYVTFTPMYQAGPIERFQNFHREAEAATHLSAATLSTAMERILLGFAKKLLLADLLLWPITSYLTEMVGGMFDVRVWSGLVAGYSRIWWEYMDFSGYTDLAVGTGLLFGIKLMENFNFPVVRSTLPDYWRAWHISLSSWCRDYVYVPVLLRYRRADTGTLLSFVVMGLWHEGSAAWFLWGVHNALGVILTAHFVRWAHKRPWVQQLRTTKLWTLFALLAVWWHQSIGRILTYTAPYSMMGSFRSVYGGWVPYLRLYLRYLTFGAIK